MTDIEGKKARFEEHLANILYVQSYHQRMRELRGSRSQQSIAEAAGVVQSYISRVESGSTAGVGYHALRRILAIYKELDDAC